MDAGPSALEVVLGTVAFAIGTILIVFTGGLLFARNLRWKLRDLPLINKQLVELSAQHHSAASRWLRRRMFVSTLAIALLFVAILGKQWYLLPAFLILLPLSLVLYALEILDLKYALVNLPFWPMRLLTADAATRFGTILLVIGLIASFLCIILAIVGGLATTLVRVPTG